MNDPWKQWQKHYECLGLTDYVKDGIADYEAFNSASCRVLFVLKGPHGWPGADMRDQLRKGAQYQVWHTIARWAAGILTGFPAYGDVNTSAEKNRALRSVAGINLKKVSGAAQADASVINSHAYRDRDLIRAQITHIKPDIIVACSTWDPLIWILELPVEDFARPTQTPIRDTSRGAWVVPWRHPARGGGVKYYEELKARLSGVL